MNAEAEPAASKSARDDGEAILVAKGLSKEFNGFKAVSNVDLSVRRGHIHALLGPNGAGKTTCFNLLTKFLSPSAGTIAFKGMDITRKRPADVANLGLVRSFQISAIFPKLTVAENIRIALQRKRYRDSFQFWQSETVLRDLQAGVDEMIETFGLSGLANTVSGDLPYGRKRALEMATTVALDPEMMLLDEPMAGISHHDIEPITELIRSAAKNRTILMVEHNMSVVASLSNRITVLAQGAVLAEGSYASVSADPRVIQAYIGAQSHG